MVRKPMISQRPWGLFNVPKNLFWTRVVQNKKMKKSPSPGFPERDFITGVHNLPQFYFSPSSSDCFEDISFIIAFSFSPASRCFF